MKLRNTPNKPKNPWDFPVSSGETKIYLPEGMQETYFMKEHTSYSLEEIKQVLDAINSGFSTPSSNRIFNRETVRRSETVRRNAWSSLYKSMKPNNVISKSLVRTNNNTLTDFIVLNLDRELIHEVIVTISTELKFRDARDLSQLFYHIHSSARILLDDRKDDINTELTLLFNDINRRYHMFEKRTVNSGDPDEQNPLQELIERYGEIKLESSVKPIRDVDPRVWAIRYEAQRNLYKEKVREIVKDAITDIFDKKSKNSADSGLTNLNLDRLPIRQNPHRTAWVVVGGPASGKGHVAKELEWEYRKNLQDICKINPDYYKELLLSRETLTNQVYHAAATHQESSIISEKIKARLKKMIEDGNAPDIMFDVVKPSSENMKLATQGSATVNMFVVTCDPILAIERAFLRGERGEEKGRYVPPSIILSGHKHVSKLLPEAINEASSVYLKIYDTVVPNGAAPKLIAAIIDRSKTLAVYNIPLMLNFMKKYFINDNARKQSEIYVSSEKEVTSSELFQVFNHYITNEVEISFIKKSISKQYAIMNSRSLVIQDLEDFIGEVNSLDVVASIIIAFEMISRMGDTHELFLQQYINAGSFLEKSISIHGKLGGHRILLIANGKISVDSNFPKQYKEFLKTLIKLGLRNEILAPNKDLTTTEKPFPRGVSDTLVENRLWRNYIYKIPISEHVNKKVIEYTEQNYDPMKTFKEYWRNQKTKIKSLENDFIKVLQPLSSQEIIGKKRINDLEEEGNNKKNRVEPPKPFNCNNSEIISKAQDANESSETDNKDIENSVVAFVNDVKYNNQVLNHHNILAKTYRIGGVKAINSLLELSQDKEVAEQILLAVDDIGVEKVLEIFFRPVKSTDLQTIQQTHDEEALETIAKIETIIGKDALTEITGWYKYVSVALSNNPFSASATKVIEIIGSLADNLEEWLDFGIAYESIDVENQITIILSQLEHWFDFVASGTTFVGLPPRYPGFDPDDEPNGGSGGGSSGSQGLLASGDNGNQNESVATFFVGLNTTAMLDS